MDDIAYLLFTNVWFEPTDINKARKPFLGAEWKYLTYISPNVRELDQMYIAVTGNKTLISEGNNSTLDHLLEKCVEMAKPLLEYINTVIVTLGERGVLLLRNCFPYNSSFPIKGSKFQKEITKISGAYFPVISSPKVISVSGSGDCLAATVASGILQQLSPEVSIQAGMKAAALSVSSYYTVPDNLNSDIFSFEINAEWAPKLINP